MRKADMADKKVTGKMPADAGIPPKAKASGQSRTAGGAQPKNTPAASEDTEKLRTLAMFCAAELEKLYPDARCSLDYGGDPWRLLVMARLSAQCTDERVNIVCRELFARFGTAAEMAEAPLSEIEDIVRPCGLFRMKASSIKAMSEKLVREYGGEIPRDIDELQKLPGVGRKTANVVLNEAFGIVEGIAVDTHVFRIAHRLKFAGPSADTPAKTEAALLKLYPREYWGPINHQWVLFGRETCIARNPKCATCFLCDLCPSCGKA